MKGVTPVVLLKGGAYFLLWATRRLSTGWNSLCKSYLSGVSSGSHSLAFERTPGCDSAYRKGQTLPCNCLEVFSRVCGCPFLFSSAWWGCIFRVCLCLPKCPAMANSLRWGISSHSRDLPGHLSDFAPRGYANSNLNTLLYRWSVACKRTQYASLSSGQCIAWQDQSRQDRLTIAFLSLLQEVSSSSSHLRAYPLQAPSLSGNSRAWHLCGWSPDRVLTWVWATTTSSKRNEGKAYLTYHLVDYQKDCHELKAPLVVLIIDLLYVVVKKLHHQDAWTCLFPVPMHLGYSNFEINK